MVRFCLSWGSVVLSGENCSCRVSVFTYGIFKDSDLGKLFKKIAFRKGRQATITVTARKLAVILWNMITKEVPYEPKNPYIFLDEKRKAIAQMRKKISKLGIDPNDLGIFSRPDYKLAYEKRVSDNQ